MTAWQLALWPIQRRLIFKDNNPEGDRQEEWILLLSLTPHLPPQQQYWAVGQENMRWTGINPPGKCYYKQYAFMKENEGRASEQTDHSANRLSAWNAISCINTPQTASPPQHVQNKALRFMITSQLSSSLWPPPAHHFLLLPSLWARLRAPAGSETRLSG